LDGKANAAQEEFRAKETLSLKWHKRLSSFHDLMNGKRDLITSKRDLITGKRDFGPKEI
jgi:hypothetical protein